MLSVCIVAREKSVVYLQELWLLDFDYVVDMYVHSVPQEVESKSQWEFSKEKTLRNVACAYDLSCVLLPIEHVLSSQCFW